MARTEIVLSFATTLEDFLSDLRDKEPLPEEELRSIFRGIRSLLTLDTVIIGNDRYQLVNLDKILKPVAPILGERIVLQRQTVFDDWEVAK